jgi:hypothetical protein
MDLLTNNNIKITRNAVITLNTTKTNPPIVE